MFETSAPARAGHYLADYVHCKGGRKHSGHKPRFRPIFKRFSRCIQGVFKVVSLVLDTFLHCPMIPRRGSLSSSQQDCNLRLAITKLSKLWSSESVLGVSWPCAAEVPLQPLKKNTPIPSCCTSWLIGFSTMGYHNPQ